MRLTLTINFGRQLKSEEALAVLFPSLILQLESEIEQGSARRQIEGWSIGVLTLSGQWTMDFVTVLSGARTLNRSPIAVHRGSQNAYRESCNELKGLAWGIAIKAPAK